MKSLIKKLLFFTTIKTPIAALMIIFFGATAFFLLAYNTYTSIYIKVDGQVLDNIISVKCDSKYSNQINENDTAFCYTLSEKKFKYKVVEKVDQNNVTVIKLKPVGSNKPDLAGNVIVELPVGKERIINIVFDKEDIK